MLYLYTIRDEFRREEPLFRCINAVLKFSRFYQKGAASRVTPASRVVPVATALAAPFAALAFGCSHPQ
eukprot:IDg5684t1